MGSATLVRNGMVCCREWWWLVWGLRHRSDGSMVAVPADGVIVIPLE